MALTSASTYNDALDQYKDNLSWEGDVTKARAFLEAVRFLLLERPTRSAAADGRSVDRESLKVELDAVKAYLAVADTSSQPSCHFVRGKAIL
jgi:hypothetical protein